MNIQMRFFVSGWLCMISTCFGTDWFVRIDGNDGAAGTSWPEAKQTIGAAVMVAHDGEIVWVSNGTYSVNQEIVITNSVSVRSINGPDVTEVNAGWPSVTNGRCFRIGHPGAEVDGFTIRGGYADIGGGAYIMGGGPMRVWTRIWGSATNDFAYGSAVGPDDAIYVTGGSFDGHPAGSGFLEKFDSTGKSIWTRRFGIVYSPTLGYTWGNSVCVSPTDGSIYITGGTPATFDEQPGFTGQEGIFILKYNANGEWQWTRVYGGNSGRFHGREIQISGDGDTIDVVGLAWGDELNGIQNLGQVLAMLFQPNGNLVSLKMFETGNGWNYGIGVARQPGGGPSGANLYAVGNNVIMQYNMLATITNPPPHQWLHTGDGLYWTDALVNPDTSILVCGYKKSARVAKLLPDGTFLWTNEWCMSWCQDNDVVVNHLAFDRDGDVLVLGDGDESLDGRDNIQRGTFIRKLDFDNGTAIWTRFIKSTYPFSLQSGSKGLAIDSHGQFYTCGFGDMAFDGQVTNGLEDCFLSKWIPEEMGSNIGGTVRNCRIIANHANSGAGIFLGLNGQIVNCSISNNSAESRGGGFFLNTGGRVESCNVAANTAWWGSDGWCDTTGTVFNSSVAQGVSVDSGQIGHYLGLRVESEHGSPFPPAGLNTAAPNSLVTAMVESPVVFGTTQYVCTGWSMAGNTPEAGSSTNLSIMITNNAVLTWLWNTEYRLYAVANTGGTVAPADSWFLSGSSVTVTATPLPGYEFVFWEPGVIENPRTLIMNQSHSITATFVAENADEDSDAIRDAWELRWFASVTNIDKTSDWDGDCFTDWQEYIAGTDPTDNQSSLSLQDPHTALLPEGVLVQWQSQPGKIYQVDRATNLISGFSGLVFNISGQPEKTTVTDTTADVSQPLFYRVGVDP